MPSVHCTVPTCPNYIPQASGGYCEQHKALGIGNSDYKKEYNRRYDREKRDKQTVSFYNSREWRTIRQLILFDKPFCQLCNREFATELHHIIPLKVDWSLRLEISNLQPLCSRCHKRQRKQVQ